MSDRDVVDIFHPRCMQLWPLLLHGCPPGSLQVPLKIHEFPQKETKLHPPTPPPLAQSIAPAEPDPLKPNQTPCTYTQ